MFCGGVFSGSQTPPKNSGVVIGFDRGSAVISLGRVKLYVSPLMDPLRFVGTFLKPGGRGAKTGEATNFGGVPHEG
jgi:hypothetical protein